MIYSIQTGPYRFILNPRPSDPAPGLELAKGGPSTAYLKTKPDSSLIEPDSDTTCIEEVSDIGMLSEQAAAFLSVSGIREPDP